MYSNQENILIPITTAKIIKTMFKNNGLLTKLDNLFIILHLLFLF